MAAHTEAGYTWIRLDQDSDGLCPAYIHRPAAGAPWPAALVYIDGIGIRPAMLELGERLAGYGYYVLLPDLYYRSGPYAPMDARQLFADPAAWRICREIHVTGNHRRRHVRRVRSSLLASKPT